MGPGICFAGRVLSFSHYDKWHLQPYLEFIDDYRGYYVEVEF